MIEFVPTDTDILYTESLKRLENILNRKINQADPLNLLLSALVYEIAVLKNDINYTANQNLLAFTQGEALDRLGELVGVYRLPAQPARTTLRFYIDEVKNFDIVIPAGTKATPDQLIFFETIEEAVISAGETYVDVEAICETEGTIGNGFLPGQINMLATPIPYITAVENVTVSMYGTDIESDEHLRERIRLAPEKGANGTEWAYAYHTKTAHTEIEDVSVFTPGPGIVKIVFTLKDGRLPTSDIIEKVKEYIYHPKRKGLTDFVVIGAPQIVNYNIDLTYYILKDYQPLVSQTQEQVNQAVQEYIDWQKTKIGRDILPEELISRLKAITGVYRVEVRQPVYTQLNEEQIAIVNDINVVYGGIVDD